MERVFQVSEFNKFISNYLGQIGEVQVEGEISELSVSQNKWLNITLKDKSASVRVFGLTYQIKNFGILEDGMKVLVYGHPKLYQKQGRFSLHANQIIPAGEGALRIAFEKLKLKLEREGLFDEARKRPLPIFPEKIGLITAKDSQAYGDFVKVLGERMGGIKIYFYPVLVQGRSSVYSILGAFEYFNENLPGLDLLVLTRGGGSLEDLISFNDEQVARAIFGSFIPVVSGVGHEKDISLADFTADLRASTPSNAAELIVRERNEVLRQVGYSINTIENKLRNKIDALKEYGYLIKRIEDKLKDKVEEKKMIINKGVIVLKEAFDRKISRLRQLIFQFNHEFNRFGQNIADYGQNIISLKDRLIKAISFWFREKCTRADSLIRLFKSLDYKKTLKRGFSITANKQGKVLKVIKDANKNDDIITRLFDGKIYSKVFLKEANKND